MTQVVVVTGAAGGIGAATCDLLEERGCRAIALDVRPTEREGAIVVDLNDPGAAVTAVAGLRRVDGLVNNAAVQLFKPLADTRVDEWNHVIDVNLRSAYVLIRALAERLSSAEGSVVNVASVHAVATSTSIAAYAASKGGLVALTRAAAIELAPTAVRVNAVLPGAVDTPALHEGFARAPDAKRALVSRTPLGRIGHPGDIAHAIDFLLDNERSGFITGQTIVVDGGVLSRLSTE